MDAISVTNARKNIYRLMKQVNANNVPVTVKNPHGKNVIWVSEDYLRDMEETCYLNSIPGMVESILEADKTPIEDCVPLEEIEW